MPSYAQSSPWIKLDRTMSAVQASVRMVRELRESGRADVTSLSIGAESEVPPPETEIRRLLSASFTCSPDYNSAVGGSAAVREATAGWIKRFIGLPAHGGNTFLVQTNGRDLLNHAFHISGHSHITAGKKPALLLPDTSWPMVNESARDAHMREVYYRLPQSGLAQAVFEAAEDIPSGDLAAIYTNSPHNPTGICTAAPDMRLLVQALEKHNEATGDRVMHIIDNPYFSGCAQNNEAPYMRSGYENVLEPDSITPWIAVISFSKAFGTAQPGLSAMIVHNALIGNNTARLSRNNGLSYAPAFFENARKIFDQKNDSDALAHFAHIRAKYVANRAAAIDILGPYLNIVSGDPNMTCLFEVPETLLRREKNDYAGTFVIKDVHDLVEYLGNETGVVVVNNSVQGRHLIRIALREPPQIMRPALEKLRDGLQRVMSGKNLLGAH